MLISINQHAGDVLAAIFKRNKKIYIYFSKCKVFMFFYFERNLIDVFSLFCHVTVFADQTFLFLPRGCLSSLHTIFFFKTLKSEFCDPSPLTSRVGPESTFGEG